MEQFKGLGVAVVTPFQASGKLDFKGFERLIEHLIAGGIDYLVVQGTTGESVTLDTEEKNAVLDFALETVNGRIPVVFGHGGNNTARLIDGLGEIRSLNKIDAILSASPYYNKPSQDGIFKHYSLLAEACDKPIILYNVPGRTGSNMLPSTTLALAQSFRNIIGIKEASGDLAQMTNLIKQRSPEFLVISGDDDLILPQMAIGADGVISVLANAFPLRMSELVKAGMTGDVSVARDYHLRFCNIIPLLFKEGNPAGVKTLLDMLGICGAAVRLPLTEVSRTLRDEIYTEVSNAGIALD